MGVKRFLKLKMLAKAAKVGLTFLAGFAASAAAVQIPEDPDALKIAAPGIALALIGAAVEAYRNMNKTRNLPGNPLNNSGRGLSGNLWALCIGLAGVGLLAGCITTEHPDGTVTTEIDVEALETAWALYERLEHQRAEVEAQRDAADAEERARLDAQLAVLEPLVAAAWADVVKGPE